MLFGTPELTGLSTVLLPSPLHPLPERSQSS